MGESRVEGGMSIPVFVILILICVVGSAFFSGAEIAIITSNRLRMHHLAREGSRAAALVEGFLESPRKMVTTTLLGTNFFNVAAAAVVTGLFTALAPGREALLSTLLVTPLLLVFGEIIPKTVFRQYADGICLRIAPVLQLMKRVLAPLVWLADESASILLRFTGSGLGRQGAFVTRQELMLLLGEGERLGLLRSEEWQMIHRAFGFSEMQVESIMVPLVDVLALEEHTTISTALPLITEHGHSRIPVYRDRIDNIVGLLYVFDLLDIHDDATVGELMHPAYFIPETKRLQQLILEMKQGRVHQAVVVDEYGGAAGIITLEDALERIVGEISDEFDRATETVTRTTGGWTILHGRTSITELRSSIGIELPEGEYRTLGGYLTSALGRIPEAGELHTCGDWEFEVLEATHRRILRVRARRSN